MNAQAIPAVAEMDKLETENDRFKRSFGSWFWGSMIAATVVHFMLFQFWPTLTAEDVSFTAEELEMIELPPEIEIPPPPRGDFAACDARDGHCGHRRRYHDRPDYVRG